MLNNTQINILIIEDDYIWRTKMQMLAEEVGLTIVGMTSSVAESKAFLEKHTVDIILADIMLKGEYVFDLYKQNKQFCKIPTILVTKGNSESDCDSARVIEKSIYLIKPVHKLTVQSAVENLLKEKFVKEQDTGFIEVKGTHNEIIKLAYKHIFWFEQKKNYCFLKTANSTYGLRKTLKEVLDIVPDHFFKVHKSFLVNKNYIDRVANDLSSIKIHDTLINIGRSYKDEVKEYLSTQTITKLERY